MANDLEEWADDFLPGDYPPLPAAPFRRFVPGQMLTKFRCEHCGRWCKGKGALARHENACKPPP